MMPDAETTAAAAARAGGVDAMVVLHFAGYPAPVAELAAAAGLPLERVVEDAAHALGTSVGDQPVGSISAATCFSFYATKNLPIGEGGMVTTNSEEIADYVKRTRLHGMSRDAWKRYLPGVASWSYEIRDAGLKANMTDVQAAIGRTQLTHFQEWQGRRRELVALYDKLLSLIDGIAPPARPETGTHAWHLYVVRVLPELGIGRDQFIASLSERGIDCSVHFIPLHKQPYFRELLGAEIDEFPNADALFEQIVSLPLYPLMADEDVVRVGVAVGAVAAAAPRASVHPGGRRSHALVAAHSPALPADEVLDLDAIGEDRHVALKES
jgi:dTDP-4-amino-4,6-dideoxygalactose transaminase